MVLRVILTTSDAEGAPSRIGAWRARFATQTTLLLERKMQLAFAAAVAALFVVGALSYRSIVASSEANLWVGHTYEVIEKLQDVRFEMNSISASLRRFVITGEDSDLDAYRAGRANLTRLWVTLRSLTADNPSQQPRLQVAENLVASRLERAEPLIALRRDQKIEAAMEIVRGGPARRITAESDEAIGRLREEELRLLGLRNADVLRDVGRTKAIVLLSTLFGMLVTCAAGWSVRRDSLIRGKAETSLRNSQEEYRMLLDGVQDNAIFMIDPAGRVVSWNSGAERIKGYAAADIIDHDFACFFTPDDIERGWPKKILELTAANGEFEELGTRVRKDGSRYLANVTFTALRDANGALRGFSEFSHDVSESREAGAKYRGLLEAAPDAMVVVDQAGDIVLLNLQAEKKFGYRRDELLGQKITNIIPTGFAERLIADELRSPEDALDQQIGTGIELLGRRKDGREFPIEIMLSPLASAKGTLVTAAIRDISARKMAELNLLHKVDELNRSNEELGQFAYVASHDLQEPLRMVASYTQLLSRRYKGKLDADADEFIAFAVDGATRMQLLIQDLLAYSRVDSKGKALVEVSSEDALQRALMNLRSAIEESGALVTHGPLPLVIADQTQLTQLFQNLIGNAIKYQGPGIPEVYVAAVRTADKWTFSVKDNGLGIDPQYFQKIFGMFQRLHKREEFAGTGIGLAICKKIVERHGGVISVESEPGHGSTFRFALSGGEQK